MKHLVLPRMPRSNVEGFKDPKSEFIWMKNDRFIAV